MKTLSSSPMLRPFSLLITATFCLVGCSSPEPATTTPEQMDNGVVEMEIQTPSDKSSNMEEPAQDAPKAGSGSSADETDDSSGLSLTAPNS